MKGGTLLSYNLKRKVGYHGMWKSCICELDSSSLVFYNRGSLKQEIVFPITNKTIVQAISSEKSPRIMLQSENGAIFLAAESMTSIVFWTQLIKATVSQNHTLSMNDFNIISVLGRGYYGKVMLVEHKSTTSIYALKTVHKSRMINEKKVDNVIAERNILLIVDHPFIVSLKFAFQTESKLYLGLEYVPGGELFHLVQNNIRIPQLQIRFYIAEVAVAIQYLHSLKVLYRDLKLENVLICEDGHIKLTDFGLSKWLGSTPDYTTRTFCGTNEYLAPEVIMGANYGFEIDWWALGIFTFEFAFGKTPFHDANEKKIYQNILKKDPKFPKSAREDLIGFVSILLEKDPKKRANFDDIKRHVYMKGINWNGVISKDSKPPYMPYILSGRRATNFSSSYRNEPKKDSDAAKAEDVGFDGFSYFGDFTI